MALLAGLDHDALPALLLVVAVAAVLAVAGEHRRQGVHAQFGGLLDDEIHLPALEQGLDQGQGRTRRGVLPAPVGDLGGHQSHVAAGEHGGDDPAPAVEELHRPAGPQAQHPGDVAGLGAGEGDGFAGKAAGWQEEASHGPCVAQTGGECTPRRVQAVRGPAGDGGSATGRRRQVHTLAGRAAGNSRMSVIWKTVGS